MSTIDNGRPEKSPEIEQARKRLRQLMPIWHPDRAPVREQKGYAVIDVLTRLYNALDQIRPREIRGEKIKNLSRWPGSFDNDNHVTFPAFSPNEPERTIFIPKTPEEFVQLLEEIEQNRSKNRVFPDRHFPRVTIREIRSGEDDEENEEPRTEMIDAIVQFTDTAESIEELKKTFKAHTYVDMDRLQAVGIPKKIDDRFLFLIMREASKATTPDIVEDLRKEVEKFSYYTPGAKSRGGHQSYARQTLDNRLKELQQGVPAKEEPSAPDLAPDEQERQVKMKSDREAMYQFFDEIRDATTLEQLEAIGSVATNRNFFNRGNLGLVKAAITFRQRKIARES